MSSIFIYAASIITLLWYSWLILKHIRTKNRTQLPPGPRGLPILGYLFFLEPELHAHFAKLARKYGPILSLKRGTKTTIIVTSPAMAREILKEQDTIFANRHLPTVCEAFQYSGNDIVFKPYGPEWRMLRKVCVQDMLGHSTLESFYCYRRREVRDTIRYLHGLRGSSAVNVGEQMFLSVLNVITSMLWGGTISGSEWETIGAEFRSVVAEITELLGRPNVSDFIPGLSWLDLQGMKKQMRVLAGKLDRIFNEIIGQRLGKNEVGGEGRDFLQVLLRLRDGGDEKIPLTMDHVKALLVNMVVGGTDTTSSTVEFALAEMMNKPNVMVKAQKELDEVVGRDKPVEESDVEKLPYLNAVMKEVLRLHPALPLMVPHCPSKESVVSNYTVPKGSRVFVNVWAIHRDPSIWENPTKFDPERFL